MRWYGIMPPVDRAIISLLGAHAASRPEGLHGYELAVLLDGFAGRPRDSTDYKHLRSNGTVYKALYRLSRCGALTSRWEDPDIALEAKRPRRRYYFLTENGLARARNLERARLRGANRIIWRRPVETGAPRRV